MNETVVRRYFPNEDPIEKRIDGIGGEAWKAIVGIVADVKNHGLNAELLWLRCSQRIPESQTCCRSTRPRQLAENKKHWNKFPASGV